MDKLVEFLFYCWVVIISYLLAFRGNRTMKKKVEGMGVKEGGCEANGLAPKAPAFERLDAKDRRYRQKPAEESCRTGTGSRRDLWDLLFIKGYRADVWVRTDTGAIPAHACVLGMASPVINSMLNGSKSCSRSISILGVSHEGVWVFIRFLYSSCYEQDQMNQFVIPLLVLSHSFVIPSLKQECVRQLEKGLLTTENVADVFQLAQLCDAPRLRLLSYRLIAKSFDVVSTSDGWEVMKRSNPKLAKEIVECMENDELRMKERLKKSEEKKLYLQLNESMEALVHICRDGCQTIGPIDKVLKGTDAPCNFPSCRGLESLVRHFARCRKRVLGGCSHCKRMWQLFELHSRLCNQMGKCRVPLCSQLKEKMKHQKKKDELLWKTLASKIVEARTFSGASLVSSKAVVCA